MRVAVFPSDDGGCGWYRLRWPAENLARQGHDVTVDPPLGFYRWNGEGEGEPARLFLDADVAVVQRITTPTGLEFVAALKDHGHRVVVDVDDDLDALPDGHPYRAQVDGTLPGQHRDILHEVCRLADVVTCSTHPLVERYGYGKGVVLPNLVPERLLGVKPRRKGPPRVGWTGRPISHIDDAGQLRGVGRLADDRGWRFAAWGQSASRTFQEVGVPPSARVTVPFRPLRSGFHESVAELSLGLVPLRDTGFNRAKSWLKGIEYAALGVPFVASDLPEYRKLAGMGAGLVVGAGEWVDAVGDLMADDRRRADMAEAGRVVMADLTYEQHSARWWQAWTAMLPQQSSCGASMSGPVEGHSSPALVDSL